MFCVSWVYPDGLSMVCDVFVMSMYKAGGLLEPYTHQIQVNLNSSSYRNIQFTTIKDLQQFVQFHFLFVVLYSTLLMISQYLIFKMWIQVTEFTPRDSYQMDFFLLSKSQRPPPCQVDDLPYCRILLPLFP